MGTAPFMATCATVFSNSHQTSKSTEGEKRITGAAIVTIKSVVIPLQVDYLEQAAKERGISRTKLVRIVMEKVVRDELVSEIVSDDDLAADTPQPRYRRFRDRASLFLTALGLEQILHPFQGGMASVLGLDPMWGAASAIGSIPCALKTRPSSPIRQAWRNRSGQSRSGVGNTRIQQLLTSTYVD